MLQVCSIQQKKEEEKRTVAKEEKNHFYKHIKPLW